MLAIPAVGGHLRWPNKRNLCKDLQGSAGIHRDLQDLQGFRVEFPSPHNLSPGAKFGLLFVFIANMLHLKPKLSSNPSHSENSNPPIHTTLTLATLTLSLSHTQEPPTCLCRSFYVNRSSIWRSCILCARAPRLIYRARNQIWTSVTISCARANYSRNSVMHELCPAFRHHFHAALISQTARRNSY